jgi:hypothetical protein
MWSFREYSIAYRAGRKEVEFGVSVALPTVPGRSSGVRSVAWKVGQVELCRLHHCMGGPWPGGALVSTPVDSGVGMGQAA